VAQPSVGGMHIALPARRIASGTGRPVLCTLHMTAHSFPVQTVDRPAALS